MKIQGNLKKSKVMINFKSKIYFNPPRLNFKIELILIKSFEYPIIQ